MGPRRLTLYGGPVSATLFWQGFWRLADPKISLASFAGLWLGACSAAAYSNLHWGWLALTILGVFCVEVAKNASGEIVDYDSGTDLAINETERTPFSGGKRVLVDGLLTREQTAGISRLFFLAAVSIGLVLVFLIDYRILFFGLAGMALAWFYHAAPVRLAYRGLGEAAVALAYGPLVVCGTYFVQTSTLSAPLVHVSCALGLHVAGFLWINEFPDSRADKAAGKRHLVVRLGTDRAANAYVVLLASAYCWLAFASLAFPGATGYLWGLVGLPLASFSAWRLLQRTNDIPALVPAQAASLGGFVMMALGAGTGYLLSTPGT
ncbi:1,4-dihydroxy-2-naphthoate octaprenyltransferase [Pseudohalioglobus lutimaris]|uniref:1,4-dihydroxy-2-naphthoate octaprenyltransferase n=1 Tax=Pseudohalioglobus lutimaris TaxID=1737061 RepID=A0A2N5X824_9GAMM|nr:1,4-dihydroxy-2-naphthoate octaprenyltransferase [Pseudohalioglobus lutimaris]